MNNPHHKAHDIYDSTRQAWEDIWAHASVEAEFEIMDQARAEETLGVYPAYLSRDGVILEAGCGLATVIMKLRDQGFKVIGMDYAEQALHTAHDYDASLDLQVGDVHALPYADNALHGYLSFGVLEHFEHGLDPALIEANRVLAPGGMLVLTIPYPNLVWRLVQLKRRVKGKSRLTNDDFYESTYTQHELIDAVQRTGFQPVLVRPTSHSFTLWGLGGPFQGEGYYRTSTLADVLGRLVQRLMPWTFNFSTMVIARKVHHVAGGTH